MDIRFGVITPQEVLWEELVERWQTAELLGFDHVWVADHWVNFMQPDLPWFDGWTLLAALATQTTTIRLGPLISPISFHNPAFLARRAMTVDQISGGRLELGLGAGIPGARDPSYAMAGVDDEPGSKRVARLAEGVTIIDQLLREGRATFAGRYYTVHEAVMQPRPVQQPRPPITIGASRPAMRKLAARHADTWNVTRRLYPFSDAVLTALRELNQAMDATCIEIGRDPASLRRSVLHFHPDPGMEFPFESAASFEEILASVLDAGYDEIILQYPTRPAELPLFERVATEVLPKLRLRFGAPVTHD